VPFPRLFDPYPKKFGALGWLDLTTDGARWHPFRWQFWYKTWTFNDQILSVSTRGRNKDSDRRVWSSGTHAPDGSMSWAGYTVVICQTPGGALEFAVPNPDVRLVLSYFRRSHNTSHSDVP
jgi:hypothetical protein